MKFLIFLLVVISAIFLFRQRKKTTFSHTNSKQAHKPQTITMVQCEYCHIHLPENEAISHDNHYWCSKEHQLLGHNKTS